MGAKRQQHQPSSLKMHTASFVGGATHGYNENVMRMTSRISKKKRCLFVFPAAVCVRVAPCKASFSVVQQHPVDSGLSVVRASVEVRKLLRFNQIESVDVWNWSQIVFRRIE